GGRGGARGAAGAGAGGCLGRAGAGAARRGGMVAGLLGRSRLRGEPIARRPTPLGPLVAEVVARLDASGRDVEWRIASLPEVDCDPALVGRVLRELLDNALKFSRPRARAVVEVGWDGTALSVKDNGVGFAM